MNGKGRKCYDVIRLSFEELNKYLEKEIDYAGYVVLTTTDVEEIRDFMAQEEPHRGRKRVPEDYSVEYYEIDEDGEFLDGSNFDPMERFLTSERVNEIKAELGSELYTLCGKDVTGRDILTNKENYIVMSSDEHWNGEYRSNCFYSDRYGACTGKDDIDIADVCLETEDGELVDIGYVIGEKTVVYTMTK